MAAHVAPHRVIIDCDPGVDDMMALCVALSPRSRPKMTVDAITICFGNSDELDVLARNARYALYMCGLPHIPVIVGAAGPIVGGFRGHGGKRVHGDGAIGGVVVPEAQELTTPAQAISGENAAARAMVDRCIASPGEISIITLGPMTNLAAALAMDPSFASTVRSVYSMAGSIGVPGGNAWAAAEANVGNDPHAAKACFTHPHLSITMAGLHLTHTLDLSPLRARMAEKSSNDVSHFLHAISKHYCELLTSWGQIDIPVHDPAAVIALLAPHLFTGKRAHVDVEAEGTVAQGATIADWNGHWRSARAAKSKTAGASHVDDRANILMTVNVAAFNEEFMACLDAIDWIATTAEKKGWKSVEEEGGRGAEEEEGTGSGGERVKEPQPKRARA